VLVDRSSGQCDRCSVAVDDVVSGQLALSTCVIICRQGVAFVGGPMTIRQVGDRYSGFESAVDGCEMSVVGTPNLTVAAGRQIGAEIADHPATHRPTAVFCGNDLLALGVLQKMTLRGLRVPGAWPSSASTTSSSPPRRPSRSPRFRQPHEQLGRTAAQLLLEEAGSPDRHVAFQPDLVVSASSAPRRQS
jgi:LacI family transcriptional regulator